jgi:hypothetical protein
MAGVLPAVAIPKPFLKWNGSLLLREQLTIEAQCGGNLVVPYVRWITDYEEVITWRFWENHCRHDY